MKRTLLFLSFCLLLTGCGLASHGTPAPAAETPEAHEESFMPVKPSPAPPAPPAQPQEPWERYRLVLANGVLYAPTGRRSTVEARCGNMDGRALFVADPDAPPSADDPAAIRLDFQYGPEEGIIELLLDGEWWVYERAVQDAEIPG